MNFKKNVLSTAVCLAATGLSAGVQAAYNIDAATPTALVYANELTPIAPATVLTLTDTGSVTIQDFTGILNPNSVPNATDVRVTIALSNGATFADNPTMDPILDALKVAVGVDGNFNGDDSATSLGANAALDGDDVTTSGNSKSFSVFSGGKGQSTVTFNGNAGLGFDPGRTFTIHIKGITVANHDPVAATVTIQAADNFGATQLKQVANLPYLAFTNALATVCTPDSAQRIDVSQSSFFFEAAAAKDNTTTLGSIQLPFTARLDNTSKAIPDADTILSNLAVTLTHSGGWSPLLPSSTTAGTPLDFSKTTSGNNASDAGVVGDLTPSKLNTKQDLLATAPVANNVPISQGSITATFLSSAKAGYTSTSSSGTCSLSSLVKNGSSDRITFLLTPQSEGGVFKGWVRISNPSTIGGNVFLKLTNDLGVSASFPMNAITGLSAALAAKTSTGLISNDALLAAAKTVVPTFTALVDTNGDGVMEKGKLRLEVDAEFGDGSNAVSSKIGIEGTHAPTGVNVQAVTTATDNTSFFTTQPE